MSKKIKLSNLIPDDKNNNKHTAYGMDLLEKSVNKVGIIESITVSNDDKIISGNARHEVIGKNFDKEAIVIETDGTQPIIIKRTDIESDTKQFYEASILANTTAKKNIDFDIEIIESLGVEYDIDVVDLGVDVWGTENNIDYSILNDDDVSGQLADMANGVKKAIQIEFEAEHYEKAYELVKFWREQKAYVGGMIMEYLKSEKEKI